MLVFIRKIFIPSFVSDWVMKKGDLGIDLILVIIILITGILLALMFFHRLPKGSQELYSRSYSKITQKFYSQGSAIPEDYSKKLRTIKLFRQETTLTKFTNDAGSEEHSTERLNLMCKHYQIVYIKLPRNVTVQLLAFNITNGQAIGGSQ